MVGLPNDRLPSWVSGMNPVFHKPCLFPNHRKNPKRQKGRVEFQAAEWHRSLILCFLKNRKSSWRQISSPPFTHYAQCCPAWWGHHRHQGDLWKRLLKGVKSRWSSETFLLFCQFVTGKVTEMGKNGRGMMRTSWASFYLEGKRFTGWKGYLLLYHLKWHESGYFQVSRWVG